MDRFLTNLKKIDWMLFSSVVLLICAGLAALYSVNLGSGGTFLNFKKQIVFAVVGFCLLFFFSFIDYRLYKTYAWLFYGLAVFLLISVLLWGATIRGTRGWFELGLFNVQPVEVVKMIALFFLASYYAQWARLFSQFKHIFISGFLIFTLFLLALLQPDFGSAALLFFIWFGLLMVIGVRKVHLISLVVLIVGSAIVMWSFVLQPYQKDRISVFLDPQSDPLGRGYNLIQSLVATGAGGVWGRGLGFGSQSQLKFLPESQTDFIFAVIAEELGLFGVFLILLFYGILFYRLYVIASRTKDDFALFFVIGVAVLFFSQIFINVGMNLGIMPVTGITLPLVSYGGSSLIVTLIILGVIQNIAIKSDSF